MAMGSTSSPSKDSGDKPQTSKQSSTGATVPAASTDTAEAHTDRVAMVSRTKDGEADQSADYQLLVPANATDEQRRAAENKPEHTQVS